MRTLSQGESDGFAPLSGRAFWIAAGVLVLGGVALRTLGYFKPLEFWLDESLWAQRFARGQVGTLRPPGYAWLSIQLIELRATEPVIRSISYMAGLLSLPLLLGTLRVARLRRDLCLLGLFVLAVHPAAITLSKEFKPYALELTLHLGLLALAFAYARSSRWWPLVGLCVLAATAPFFAWSVVVLYPGLFLVAAIVSFRPRDWRRLAVTGMGLLATTGSLLWLYVNVHANRSSTAGYWGRKYDVFFVGDKLTARFWWVLEKTYDVFAFPGHLKIFWFESVYPSPVLAGLQVILCVVGLVAIALRRKWVWALLWVSPWMVTVALNAAGKWPYGVFRTNLFLLAYSLPIALVGLDTLGRWLRTHLGARRLQLVPIWCIVYALLCFPIRPSYFSIKPAGTLSTTQSTRRAMELIAEVETRGRSPFRERKGKDLLLLDSHAYGNYRFYLHVHAETKQKLGPFLKERFRAKKGGYGAGKLLKLIERESRWGFWLVVSKRSLVAPARKQAHRFCHVDNETELPGGDLMLRCLSK